MQSAAENFIEWARGQISEQKNYRAQSRKWNLASTAILLVMAVAYWFGIKKDPAAIVMILVLVAIVSSFLKEKLLEPIRLSLFDVYAVGLVRIVDLSHVRPDATKDFKAEEFDDAVIDLVNQIDKDVTRMKDNLSASRTLQAVIALRAYLRRFATAVRDPAAAATVRKDGFLARVMGGSLLLLAEGLHKNYGIEDRVRDLEISASGLSTIPERNLKTTSRPARKLISIFVHAPAPLSAGVFILIALTIIWLLPISEINTNSRFVVSATWIVGVLTLMRDSLRKWLQELRS